MSDSEYRVVDDYKKINQLSMLANVILDEPSNIPALYGIMLALLELSSFAFRQIKKPILNWWFDLHRIKNFILAIKSKNESAIKHYDLRKMIVVVALRNETPFAIEVEKEIGNVTEKQFSIKIAHLRLYKGDIILSLDSILSTFWSSRRPERRLGSQCRSEALTDQDIIEIVQKINQNCDDEVEVIDQEPVSVS
ncbi:hypothetical protein BpHYR1_006786 [Brachionus plicatilis]|uniref:Uncharacterized protein n=1 Tax=Brachionus plicatilis TaxID=10195 RepID=A0A3M7SA25_BRAPC|nr:hypothetical protein BpHYR1_006786 [Brachionus plicatilis]